MNNCLTKELKGTFDNSDLLKVGEIRFKALIDNASVQFSFSDREQQTATAISGTITQTWENKILTVTGVTAGTVFSLPDKYKIAQLNTSSFSIVGNDIEILDYSPIVVCILDNIYGNYNDDNKVTGDITSLFENATTIEFVTLRGQNIHGNLSPLQSNNTMKVMYLAGQDIEGNLSDINSSIIRIIDFTGTKITGNLSDIATKTALQEIQLPDGVNGDVANLQNLSALTFFNCYGEYYGDLSQVGAALKFFVSGKGGSFSWTTRPTTSTIFSIGTNTNYVGNGINLGSYLDTYLANIVNCTNSTSAMKINIAGIESANTASLALALKTKISAVGGSFLVINGRTI